MLVYVVYYYREALRKLATGGKQAKSAISVPPAELCGLDVRQESLPEHISNSVLNLWQQQQHREAMSLLYRATLSALIHKYGFQFQQGDTEGECAQQVRQQGPEPLSDYVSRLTRAWQQLAYAHRLPDDGLVHELCQQWSEVFDAQ